MASLCRSLAVTNCFCERDSRAPTFGVTRFRSAGGEVGLGAVGGPERGDPGDEGVVATGLGGRGTGRAAEEDGVGGGG